MRASMRGGRLSCYKHGQLSNGEGRSHTYSLDTEDMTDMAERIWEERREGGGDDGGNELVTTHRDVPSLLEPRNRTYPALIPRRTKNASL